MRELQAELPRGVVVTGIITKDSANKDTHGMLKFNRIYSEIAVNFPELVDKNFVIVNIEEELALSGWRQNGDLVNVGVRRTSEMNEVLKN